MCNTHVLINLVVSLSRFVFFYHGVFWNDDKKIKSRYYKPILTITYKYFSECSTRRNEISNRFLKNLDVYLQSYQW